MRVDASLGLCDIRHCLPVPLDVTSFVKRELLFPLALGIGAEKEY